MLNLAARLPVLHGMNKVAGALLGAVKFLIVIWIILLVLTIVCNTKAGEAALQIIKKDCILSFIYDRDILILSLIHIYVAFITPPLTRRQWQRTKRVNGFVKEFEKEGLKDHVIIKAADEAIDMQIPRMDSEY